MWIVQLYLSVLILISFQENKDFIVIFDKSYTLEKLESTKNEMMNKGITLEYDTFTLDQSGHLIGIKFSADFVRDNIGSGGASGYAYKESGPGFTRRYNCPIPFTFFASSEGHNPDCDANKWAHGKLTWGDFSKKTYREKHSASIYSWIFSSYSRMNNESLIFHSYSYSTDESNVLVGHESDYLLNHEQKHFDLTEISTRKLRKMVLENKFTADYKSEIKLLQKKANHFKDSIQSVYDEETNHGQNRFMQAYWDKLVEHKLDKLSAYSDETILIHISDNNN